jgi:hypothetical protein
VYTDPLRSLLERIRAILHLDGGDDRRNIASLARQLDVPPDDAAWIYRRSREVGFGAAKSEYDLRAGGGPMGHSGHD